MALNESFEQKMKKYFLIAVAVVLVANLVSCTSPTAPKVVGVYTNAYKSVPIKVISTNYYTNAFNIGGLTGGVEAMTWDGSGNLWAIELGGSPKYRRFTPSGTPLTSSASSGYDLNMCFNPTDGYLYVSYFYYALRKVDATTGAIVCSFTIQGSSNGALNLNRGIAYDGLGNIFVADSGNYRIQKLTTNFSATNGWGYILKWGSQGSGDGQFNSIYDLAISGASIYVLENYRVQKFDLSGNYQSQFGNLGTNNGEFWGGFSLALDSSGNIYVADYENKNVQVFDPSGQWLRKLSLGSQYININGLAVDSLGRIYVGVNNSGVNQIEVWSPSTNITTNFNSSSPNK